MSRGLSISSVGVFGWAEYRSEVGCELTSYMACPCTPRVRYLHVAQKESPDECNEQPVLMRCVALPQPVRKHHRKAPKPFVIRSTVTSVSPLRAMRTTASLNSAGGQSNDNIPSRPALTASTRDDA